MGTKNKTTKKTVFTLSFILVYELKSSSGSSINNKKQQRQQENFFAMYVYTRKIINYFTQLYFIFDVFGGGARVCVRVCDWDVERVSSMSLTCACVRSDFGKFEYFSPRSNFISKWIFIYFSIYQLCYFFSFYIYVLSIYHAYQHLHISSIFPSISIQWARECASTPHRIAWWKWHSLNE